MTMTVKCEREEENLGNAPIHSSFAMGKKMTLRFLVGSFWTFFIPTL